MKKLLIAVFLLSIVFSGIAQKKDSKKTKEPAAKKAPAPKEDWSKYDLSTRANDHFMIQYGYDGWIGTNDTTSPSGFSRHFNFYVMLDKPFKTNPHYSVGYGLGIGSTNIFFKDRYVDLKALSPTLPFNDVSQSDQNRFKKFKLVTTFLELPIELRYVKDPINPGKGFKASVGVKLGYLLSAYTKAKNQIDKNGKTIYGSNYIRKESDRNFINSTRVAFTGRIGFGFISLDGSYQVTSFLRSGTGPIINPYSIGLTLSGL